MHNTEYLLMIILDFIYRMIFTQESSLKYFKN